MAFNNYLEDENDKPYFTTNSLAYYYDKMEGFAKAVEGSAKALNLTKEEVEKRLTRYIEQNKNELDQRLAQWDGKLETFDSSVETLLTEWVDDGTLSHVIDSTLIDQRIAPVTQKLAENTKKEIGSVAIKTYSSTTRLARKPIVSIRFDDGYTQDYTIVKPISEEYGFPVTIAYISGEDNGTAKSPLTITQMLELQNNLGWECSAHTVSTNDLTALSDEELDRQLRKSKNDLVAQGLDVETVIYPVGLNDTRVRQNVKKYYRAGLGTRNGINVVPIDQYNTYGLHIHDYTLAQIKTRIDEVKAKNGWLVLYGHSANNTFPLEEQQKFKDVIAYIQSVNVDIMTCKDALDYFENTLEIENGGTGESFKIGADGVPYSRKIDEQNHIYKPAQSYDTNSNLVKITNTTPITDFDKRKTTSISFGTGHGSGISNGTYTNMGGTLLTYRINDDDVLNYQQFTPYNNIGNMVRYWTSNGWGAWRQQALLSEISSVIRRPSAMNAFPSTAVYADFEPGYTIWDINSTGSTGFPASGGTVSMYKSAQGPQWSYQIFEQYQSANRYKRWLTDSTAWTTWATA